MTTIRVMHPHIEVSPFGVVVQGTRVPVRRIWSWHKRGITCDQLWKRYPNIPPGHILSALAFAYDNTELMDEELVKERAQLGGPTPGAPEQLPLRKP